MAENKTIKVPDIGDFDSVEIIEVLVSPGDTIQPEDPLLTLESDKATMDIPAPEAGKVVKLLVNAGDKISEGTPILELEPGKSEAPAEASQQDQDSAEKQEQEPAESTAATPAEPPPAKPERKPAPRSPDSAADTSGQAHASPSVRKLARELGVDLARVSGGGRKGRITKDDVKAFTKAAMTGMGAAQAGAGGGLPEIPAVDFSQYGPVSSQPLSRIKRLSSQHLHRSWVNLPHVTQFDEADITGLEGFRQAQKAAAEKQGVKLTPLPFIMKAAVAALKRFPEFNASLAPDGQELILKQYFHIGFAVNTGQGLLVPVVRDVDQKSIFELAGELVEMAQKARDMKLSPDQMQGGCFTVSSLGHIGGTGFTPIINAPEVAIMGIARASLQPRYNSNNELEPRLILPFSVSYDHRVIDGVAGAEFSRYLGEVLTDLRQMLL